MWKQIRDANWAIPYTGGWCLNYVQRAFGTPWAGSTATDSWNRAAKKHYDLPPKGKTVPVYFSGMSGYDGDPGHIAIVLDDGNVASSTQSGYHSQGYIHPNLNHLIATYKPYHPNFKYLGWSEDLGGVDLVSFVPDTPTLQPNQRVVASAGANVRTGAGTNYPMYIQDGQPYVIDKGQVLTGKGYIRGQEVNGTDLWFVGISGNKYIHFSNFDSFDTKGLDDLTPKPDAPVAQPIETPDVYPLPTTDVLVTRVVNKKHPLEPLNYTPGDLVEVNGKLLRKEAADSLMLMMKKTAIIPQSGYRSYDYQKTLYDGYLKQDPQSVVDTYSARPGYSEHQTGLVMDFAPIDVSFENTDTFRWLSENAHRYGWINRYPKGKETITGYTYEPWHWRYVGVTVATDMKAKGVKTLEEYYSVSGGGYDEPKVDIPVDEPVEPPVIEPPVKDEVDYNVPKEIPMTVNLGLTPKIRAVIYVVVTIGSFLMTYLVAKGYVGDAESALWTAISGFATLLALGNTPTEK